MWLGEPRVRRRVNQRISGHPDQWPLDWLADTLRTDEPFQHALSLGCGTGPLERDLLRRDLCRSMLAIDLSPDLIELARQQAESEGLGDRVRYRVADLDRLTVADLADSPGSTSPQFDAVFFHQSLHHVAALESCLDVVATVLAPGGVLYLDEYVGPSRNEWDDEAMRAMREVYAELPETVRRAKQIRPPVDWRDPSEAVRSSAIASLVASRFDVVTRRDYGGNLLAFLYGNLRSDVVATETGQAVLDELLDLEDEMLAAGAASYYAVILARKS